MPSTTDANHPAFRTLATHLQLAAADLTLFYALCRSIDAHDSLTRCAHDFVWFTVRALRDAGLTHLYRLFDTNKSAISLPRFIKASSYAPTTRDADLREVSAANPLVKKLLRLRHEAVGHTSDAVPSIGLDGFMGGFDLSQDELQQLLSLAHRQLAQYGRQRVPLVTSALAQQALVDVSDLARFLDDAIPSRHGLEQVAIEQDGRPRSKGPAA